MKRTLLMGLMAAASVSLAAQSLPPSGYYRVNSVSSERYITIIDAYGSLNMSAGDADMGALRTFDYSEGNVVSNPASVIYADFKGGNKYDLQAQGTGAYAIVGHVLQLQKNDDGTYGAFASMSGITKYLYEYKSNLGNFGGVGINNYSATNKAFRWNVLPLSSSDATNYFGIKPDVQIGSEWYDAFYADFNFNFASEGMQAFYVTKVDAAKGVAVYEEIKGDVPRATPVYVKCASDKASDNRLNILTSTVAAISGNQLAGVYFCSTTNLASSTKHINSLVYDENTMRVLGKTSDGSLGFIKAPDTSLYIEVDRKTKQTVKYIPANTAYLKVASGAPAELKLVSKEEYEKTSTVTVTAKSYTRVYGDANPTFGYDASATLNGTPELKCEATATSPVGTYPITVSQGTVTGVTVVGVAGTLTITAAPLTVTAQAATREYGAANPALTFTYSGWKNGETDAVLTTKPTATTTATQASDAGQYDITVSGGAAQNYTFSYVPAKLTVTKAKLTATAANAEREYGAANPAFTITYTGFKNSDTEAKLATKPTVTTTATATTPVGTAPITVSGGSDKNYDFTYVAGTLTINRAPLKVKADDKTRAENTDNPALTVTYTGFKNGETEAVLDTKPTVTTTATKASAPGTYPITVSGGSAKNYTLSYENGTLTVTAGTLVLTARSYSRVYGEENPTFAFDQSGTATLKGTPAISCSATKTSPVGTYDIVIAKGSVENENVTYVNGTLTITKAELTVKADDATRFEGEENPVFTLTYSGWKNGETEAVLTTKPVATTTAGLESKPGEYAITVSGGEATNYSFKYVEGKLTVIEHDGIADIIANGGKAFDVYDVAGRKVRTGSTTLEGLPAGIYVVNGKKILVK